MAQFICEYCKVVDNADTIKLLHKSVCSPQLLCNTVNVRIQMQLPWGIKNIVRAYTVQHVAAAQRRSKVEI